MQRENGNILFYILIAVVLLGALSYVMSRGGSDSAAGMSATRIAEDIKAQAQSVRAAILECNLVYNNGYPADPSVPTSLADVECQTDNATPTPTKVKIFSGATGRFVPQTPPPFTTGWVYGVDTGTAPNAIYIELSDAMVCTGNQGLVSAFEQLNAQFTASELGSGMGAGKITECTGAVARFRLYLVRP